MKYTVHIGIETDKEPTDLELGDLLTTVSECFQNPRIESPDGYFVAADYTVETYDMELYDTKGRRVWRYMYGELLTDSDSLVVEHSLLLPSPTKEEADLFNSVFPLDDEMAIPPDSRRGWQVTLRRFFGF